LRAGNWPSFCPGRGASANIGLKPLFLAFNEKGDYEKRNGNYKGDERRLFEHFKAMLNSWVLQGCHTLALFRLAARL